MRREAHDDMALACKDAEHVNRLEYAYSIV